MSGPQWTIDPHAWLAEDPDPETRMTVAEQKNRELADVKAATGAKTYGEGPHRAARPLHVGEAPRLDASNDTEFRPDQALADGAVVSGNSMPCSDSECPAKKYPPGARNRASF